VRGRTLKQPHPAEAAALAAIPEDEMVDDRQIHRFAGMSERTGRAAVARARGRVAARVVVGEDHARAAEPGGVGDDPAHRQADRVGMAVVAAQMDAASALVEVGDEQLLAAPPFIEAGREKCAGGMMAGKDGRVFGTLNLHSGKLGPARGAS